MLLCCIDKPNHGDLFKLGGVYKAHLDEDFDMWVTPRYGDDISLTSLSTAGYAFAEEPDELGELLKLEAKK